MHLLLRGVGALASAFVMFDCPNPQLQSEPLPLDPDEPCACFGPAPALDFQCESSDHCGRYLTYEAEADPCQGPPGQALSDRCTREQQGNDDTFTCIRTAAADGQPFRFEHVLDQGGAAGESVVYRFDGDTMLTERERNDGDGCLIRHTDAYRAPDIADCHDWGCVLTALRSAQAHTRCDAWDSGCQGDGS